MFGGMPSYLVELDWSDGLLTTGKIILGGGLPHPVRNIFIAFISFYILLLSFKVRPWLAIAGALAFGLSTYMLIGLGAGHNARIGAIAFMPLVMAGIHTCLYRNTYIGLGLTALAVALQLRENHLQITYYLLFIIAIYGIVSLADAIKKGQVKPFVMNGLLLMLSALLALGTFYGKFWAISEYSEYSIYGGSSSNLLVTDEDSEVRQALQRANSQEMANQLARYSRAYWGPQAGSAPYYAGAVICFLFVLGLFFAPRRLVVWLVITFGLGIILSWGANWEAFNYAMFDYFPGYNKFRSVTFAIVLSLFAMPLLGFVGLESYLGAKKDKVSTRKFLYTLSVTAGICLLIALFAGTADFMREGEEQLPDWFLNALTSDREALLRGDAFRSLVFILLAAAAVYFHAKEKLSILVMSGILTVLVAGDLWAVNKRYFNEENYRRSTDRGFFVATPADQKILRDPAEGFRVYELRNPFNEARTSYFHSSLGGYHGAKLRRYQDLIEYCISPETQELITSFQSGTPDMGQFGVLNMLNTKYFVFGADTSNIIRNPAANGNAWFVNNVIAVSSPDEAISRTCEINTRREAVVNTGEFELPGTTFSNAGSIEATEYSPDNITYRTQNSGEGLAVFSEIYYPEGWEATIDGEPAQIIRANYVLRAMVIPAGEHTVAFTFRPDSYYIGDTIMFWSSIILILAVAGCFILGWKRIDFDSETEKTPAKPSAA